MRPARAGGSPAPAAEPAPAAREPLWRHIVGGVLRQERLAQGRTLKEVSETARISMAFLSEVERGRKEASSEVLAAAAGALGMGLADILALAQEELVLLAAARAARDAERERRILVRTGARRGVPLTNITGERAVPPRTGSRTGARPGGMCLAA
ncbi:helix-turn-helix transcriptional regulator [Streptomyces sp. SP18CS02]|nr:helix-turn-helix transcriptional regulator [Streptomyces sp. SP18CS02]MEE1753569.1 helix-turn-helix transcriptional regulator [Streptomyces sp. SP18CS02]